MNSVKKLIILIAISFVLFISLMPLSVADTTEIVTDDEDDVLLMSLDYSTEGQSYTSTKPNLDITKITYFRADNSNEVSITLEVKGEIENVNDFEDYYNLSDLTGGVTTYLIYLETTNNTYEVSYIDEVLEFSYNDVSGDYTVNNNELTVTFELSDGSETFVSLYAYSMSLSLSDTTSPLSVDIAPNEALFVPTIDAPDTADVGEEIDFTGGVNDVLGFGYTLADDPYLWDFNDGTTSTEQNPTHSYNFKGTYTVTLTVESSDGETSSATKVITVGEESSNNGNTNNGGSNNGGDNGDSDDDSGSGFMLFIGVVVVIIIIGIVALVVVIRR